MFRFLQFTLLAVAATAFTAHQPFMRQPAMASSTARHLIMSDAETAAILEKAEGCMGEECSIDEVAELLVLLKDTQKSLEGRLENVMNLVGDLQKLNEKEGRETDEVRAFVRDMLRVFSSDKPSFAPMGYSGDIGDGPMTAYDVLPPKKWKKPSP